MRRTPRRRTTPRQTPPRRRKPRRRARRRRLRRKKRKRTTTSPADGLFFVLSFRAGAAREGAGCPNLLSAGLVFRARGAAGLLAVGGVRMVLGSGRKKAGQRNGMM